MTRLLSPIAASLLLVLVGLAGVGEAQAGPLDDAKAQGLVGERPDGYVGVVDGNGDVQALVDRINAGRKEKYAEVAAKRGAPIEAVAQIAGEKLIERTPPGQYVMTIDGRWRRK